MMGTKRMRVEDSRERLSYNREMVKMPYMTKWVHSSMKE